MDTPADDLNILSLPDEVLCLVFSYLTLNDLKELRLTCNRFNDAIVKSSTFKNRSKILVDSENLSEVAESINRKNRLNFRNVEFIRVDDCSEMASIMHAISTDVQQLALCQAPIYDTLASVELHNLHRLEVLTCGNEKLTNWNLNAYKNLNSLDLWDAELLFPDRFFEELNISVAGKIKSLAVRCENEVLVLSVLKLNTNSLNDLKISLNEPPKMYLQKQWGEVFQNMIALKTLTLFTEQSCGEWIYEIVAALPEAAQLNRIAINGGLEMMNELLVLVARKFQNTIQDVRYSGGANITRSGLEELLRVAHNLKKLDISYCDITFDYFTLDNKPMIQELNLSGLWKLTEDCVCNLAQKMPNLVSLKLGDCALGTTNKTLAYIFHYQTRLRTLILSGCNEITDKGLMGLGEEKWPLPMPITRLKQLEALDLRGIRILTDQPFHEVVAFKELRKFGMCESNQITNEAIVSLTKNCPGIEKLYLPNCPQLTIHVLDIIATNLKRLRKFDVKKSNIFDSKVMDNFYKKNLMIKRS